MDEKGNNTVDLRVAIVGAGLAGLACAVAAARAGASVDLYEAHAAPQALAAHVDVVPNLLRDLVSLGVGDDCVRVAFPYRRTDFSDLSGRTLFTLEAARLAGERYPAAMGILHAALTKTLAASAARHGARVHFGERVTGVEPRSAEGAALLHTDSGSRVTDLLVLASGSHGRLPAGVRLESTQPALAEHAWTYLLAPRPPQLQDALIVSSRGGHKAHAVPLPEGLAGIRISTGSAAVPLDTPAAVRQALAQFPAPLASLADRLRDDTPVQVRRVTEAMRVASLAEVSVLAVGDLAHAFAPHFGQSAAQAVEDAVVLGQLIAQFRDATSLATVFVQRRSARVQRVFEITSQAARWDARPGPDTDFPALARSLADTVGRPA